MTIAMALVVLTGCQPAESPDPPASQAAVTTSPTAPAPSAAPAADEKFVAIGTEPFWNVTLAQGQATYKTPENQDGQSLGVAVSKQGTSRKFVGTLDGQPFVLTLRPENCSDGMSDRNYAYAADLSVAGEARKGCAEPGTALKPE